MGWMGIIGEDREVGTSYGGGWEKVSHQSQIRSGRSLAHEWGIVGRVGTQVGTFFFFTGKFLVNFRDPNWMRLPNETFSGFSVVLWSANTLWFPPPPHRFAHWFILSPLPLLLDCEHTKGWGLAHTYTDHLFLTPDRVMWPDMVYTAWSEWGIEHLKWRPSWKLGHMVKTCLRRLVYQELVEFNSVPFIAFPPKFLGFCLS